jgi:hypothetical protein
MRSGRDEARTRIGSRDAGEEPPTSTHRNGEHTAGHQQDFLQHDYGRRQEILAIAESDNVTLRFL